MQSIPAHPIDSAIALAWIGFLLYWGISAIGSRTTGKSRNRTAVALMLIAAAGLFLLLQSAFVQQNDNDLLWQRSLPLSIIALAIVLAGLFVLIWSRRTLGSNWSPKVETRESQILVQKGPYGRVRHPIYSGFLTMVLGSALAYGRILGVVALVAFTVGFGFKAWREESVLTKRYGTVYQEYKARTKAFLPYIV